MKCPSCKSDNIAGEDLCENCGEDLSGLDGLSKVGGIEKSLMEDAIARLSPHRAVVVDETATVTDAVKKMNHGRMGCVVVTEKEKVVGILTERDVLFKLLGKSKDLSKVKVGAVMTTHPDTLTAADSIAYALNKMAVGGFRHIPIVAPNEPPAIISIRDIIRYITEHVESVTA